MVEKILDRINFWKSRFISYVGYLSLIKLVLFSIEIYWASILLLLSKVIKEINITLKAFFWASTNLNRRKTKVAWEEVCFL